MLIGKIISIGISTVVITGLTLGKYYHSETIEQEKVISSYDSLSISNSRKIKDLAKEVDELKKIPCDSSKYYHDGFEAGKKVNWHWSKKNISVIKQGDSCIVNIVYDTTVVSKRQKKTVMKDKIIYHHIDIKEIK